MPSFDDFEMPTPKLALRQALLVTLQPNLFAPQRPSRARGAARKVPESCGFADQASDPGGELRRVGAASLPAPDGVIELVWLHTKTLGSL